MNTQFSIQLYDIRKKDFPRERCGSFRTVQVYRCHICGALNNKAVFAGRFGFTLTSRCPNESEPWHFDIQAKVEWLRHPHPKSYRRELEVEIKAAQRKAASKIRNDLVGSPDTSQIVDFSWTAIRFYDPLRPGDASPL